MTVLSSATRQLRDSAAGRWFAAQGPRDQRMLVLLAAFLVLVTAYLTIWVPVQDALLVARARHADALDDQRWILANAEGLRRSAARRSDSGGRPAGQALLSTVAASARTAGLTLNRFQPDGNDGLAVSLDDVEFGALLRWTEALAEREGIRIREASIDGRDIPGRVRARLVLE